MASTGAMNSTDSAIEIGAAGTDSCIKTEVEVKHESVECVVCTSRGSDGGEAAAARTASGTRLLDFLRRVVRCELGAAAGARRVCSHCLHLIDVLEQAELEYLKLKEAFEAIISKNPLFDNGRLESHTVKVEMELENGFQDVCTNRSDSEDEPLAVTKKKRNQKPVKRKLKVYPNKRKQRIKNSIEKEKNSIQRFIDETLPVEDEYFGNREVKKEDSADGSETSHFNNGLDGLLKIEVGADDLDDEDYESESADGSEEGLEGVRASRGVRGRGAGRGRRGRGRGRAAAEPKWQRRVVHQCNQCNAKYTSLKRLESHLSKHSAGMPPYICEVCGARYKHKRACDIHVALHKGISDWKCEECDKLFPSKSALQRHNNIHTGKLNYQCDLCGKSFIHTSSFKMHKLSHSGVKPHACDVCGLALMTRSHLKRHKRVHSGEKRHECGVCGKRFSERYNLAAHSKSHEVAGGAPPPDAPRRRLFRCPYCQDRFERRYMLERHVSSTHGRTLERAPATPRNTMSKLLKQQAAGRAGPGAAGPGAAGPGAAEGELAGSTAPHTPQTPADVSPPKRARSPALAGAARPPAPAALALHKLQLSSAATSVSAGAWSAAYGAEFGLRPDYH